MEGGGTQRITGIDSYRYTVTSRGWTQGAQVSAPVRAAPSSAPSRANQAPVNNALLSDLGKRGPAMMKVMYGITALMLSPAAGPLLPVGATAAGAATVAASSAPISITGPATAITTFGIGTGATSLADGNSDSSREDTITLYRGVSADHPGFANAENGIVEPYGDHGDLDAHVMGLTGSGYTSWSMFRAVANEFAGSGGIVLTADIPVSRATVNQSDPFGEYEVFVSGSVSGAQVDRRPR